MELICFDLNIIWLLFIHVLYVLAFDLVVCTPTLYVALTFLGLVVYLRCVYKCNDPSGGLVSCNI